MELTPAYGRDYKSAKEVKEAWEAGKDFVINDITSPNDGSYINKEDASKAGMKSVLIRYKKLTQITNVKVK